MQRAADSRAADSNVKTTTGGDRAPSAGELKAAFLRKLAHEMRTPLGSMLMLAELLADNAAGRLGDREIGYARKIQRAGSEIRDLLTAVLDLSRIETGAVAVEVAEVPLAELAEGLAEDFRQLAGGQSIELRVTVADGLPQALRTDRLQLTRLLRNLLGHAASSAAADVDLRFAAAAEGVPEVEIAVTHDGTAIPQDRRGTAFEPFQPGQRGSSGMALATARAQAELLGGRLELRGGDALVLTLSGRVREAG